MKRGKQHLGTKAGTMKQAVNQRKAGAQSTARRPVRAAPPAAAPTLGEILRTARSAEEIADALVRTTGLAEAAQTRLW